MKADDVHDYGTDQSQAQRRPPASEQEEASHDLESADNIEIAADKQRRHEITRGTFRRWRHRNEVQKHVRAEHDEDQSEQTASDNCCDLHMNSPFVVMFRVKTPNHAAFNTILPRP